MRVMSQTPFKGTPQVKEDQVSLEGDCRDYRNTFREMIETTGTRPGRWSKPPGPWRSTPALASAQGGTARVSAETLAVPPCALARAGVERQGPGGFDHLPGRVPVVSI